MCVNCLFCVKCTSSAAISVTPSQTPKWMYAVYVEQKKPRHFPPSPVPSSDNLHGTRRAIHLQPFPIHDCDDDDDDMAHYLGSVSCRRKYTNNNETYKNIILPHNWAYFVLNCLLLLVSVCSTVVADARYSSDAAIPQSHTFRVFTRVIVHGAPPTTASSTETTATAYYMSLMRSATARSFRWTYRNFDFVPDVAGVRYKSVFDIFSSTLFPVQKCVRKYGHEWCATKQIWDGSFFAWGFIDDVDTECDCSLHKCSFVKCWWRETIETMRWIVLAYIAKINKRKN